MEADGIHELTAAYALNALDADDERDERFVGEVRQILGHRPSCRAAGATRGRER